MKYQTKRTDQEVLKRFNKQTLWKNHLHLGDFVDAFIQMDLQPFIHTFTHRLRSQPYKKSASLAQGHLDTPLGGAGD